MRAGAQLMPLGEVFALNREECELVNPAELAAALGHVLPDTICNAAAYTAVDRAPSWPDV